MMALSAYFETFFDARIKVFRQFSGSFSSHPYEINGRICSCRRRTDAHSMLYPFVRSMPSICSCAHLQYVSQTRIFRAPLSTSKQITEFRTFSNFEIFSVGVFFFFFAFSSFFRLLFISSHSNYSIIVI